MDNWLRKLIWERALHVQALHGSCYLELSFDAIENVKCAKVLLENKYSF